MDSTSETLKNLSEALQKNKISSTEITRAYLDRIAKQNKNLNCYIHICEEKALQQAKKADRRLQKKENLNLGF